MTQETVLILDFGAQYTQLIARRIREAGVYSEILPFNTSWKEIKARDPKGIVLSGGPESVLAEGAPHPPKELYEFQGPLLGDLLWHAAHGPPLWGNGNSFEAPRIRQGHTPAGRRKSSFSGLAQGIGGVDEPRRSDRDSPTRLCSHRAK